MPRWLPDWRKLMAEALQVTLDPEGEGYVYLIADSHLGDRRAPSGEFFSMLEALPHAKLVVFLGDLFKVWLALPKFWDEEVRGILGGFENLRRRGTPILFVMGNREYFLPRNGAGAAARALPFDYIAQGACILTWGKRRYGMTHGDVINRKDHRHLKWRWITRGFWFEWLFRAMPGPLARAVAEWLERAAGKTNREIKITYPLEEIEAFAATALPGLDGFFVGHFHRDETISLEAGGPVLRIVPDWHSRRTVLRLDAAGELVPIHFGQAEE